MAMREHAFLVKIAVDEDAGLGEAELRRIVLDGVLEALPDAGTAPPTVDVEPAVDAPAPLGF